MRLTGLKKGENQLVRDSQNCLPLEKGRLYGEGGDGWLITQRLAAVTTASLT